MMGYSKAKLKPLNKLYVIGLLLLVVNRSAEGFEPISTIFAVGTATAVSFLIGGYDLIACKIKECCNDKWISNNFTGVEQALNKRIYGQHLANKLVIKLLRGHFGDHSPGKALVLSFHGSTGGGKNYVSQLIAQHIYKEGLKSKYVHMIPSTIHFKHEKEVEYYKEQVVQWVKGNVSQCARQLFIFDEIEKAPPKVLDALKPFMDHHHNIGGIDYRKAIFLFLSNIGGEAISKFAYKNFLAGNDRNAITFKDIETVLEKEVFNEQGGLLYSDLIKHHLISAFIPFLPLERSHVEQCIEDKLQARNFTKIGDARSRLITQVADELQYFPEDSKLYSTTGCKRVEEKLNLLLEDY